mmetsp:Transcript_19955/g.33012  ORF Transcript_19955/g.33012 Transcript_19955/m.33012 type:complete len:170 (-) Transcript_19955:162-671(-)|eukprot:CAMPEP_0181049010 /NCGR_PEP_ID=MMETSP1070-20121207/15737_1 /TAXON_ID=265543 /ORGANISM="Minutocellus polymorphus, Strain NH13" /LENGTH=169 /DNA_ID=CAMNT_0023127825 /DNA_START=21 /DNA_END=530 /DNA_ORIENTATION=+
MPIFGFLFASPKNRKSFHGMVTRSQVPFNDDRGAFVKAVNETGDFVLRSKRLGTPTKAVFSPDKTTPKKSPAAPRGGGGRVLFPVDETKPPATKKKEEFKKPVSVDDLCDLLGKVTIDDSQGILSPRTRGFKYLSPLPKDGSRYIDLVETKKPGILSPVKRCARFREDA